MEADEVEVFKKKQMLKYLRDAKGNGTSMISLIIPPGEQVSKTTKLLVDEYGTATNIKSRVNRLSVLGAITSAQNKLKTYTKIPKNGLALFVGTVLIDSNKEKKIVYDIEPIKPINTSLYTCDNKFHVEGLMSLLEDDTKYGFVIMDGQGALFATLQGSVQTILHSIAVDLPKKHGRGGQSAVRFSRLRVEKRLTYIKKVAEVITSSFVPNSIPNVEGIILAGSAGLKNELAPFVDARLRVIATVDINYGGKLGLNQAVKLSEEALKNLKFAKEKKIIRDFLYEIELDTGEYCYGLNATMNCLESGAVKTLIVWEECDTVYEEQLFVDWAAENYKNYGCDLILVTDATSEGAQFVKGFGGIGGLLRYKMSMDDYADLELSSLSNDFDEDLF